ncbi:flagellar motor protein MotD [Methylophaga thiooxydans]|uniref:OmpA family protein n=1 Tax=Methylophaga thiooxydans DMS010 TaxID=637616 RepID=C0N6W2_9GAMM|nr:flagellar motor protein MotD [Methylophaga thiooxydans]EEF79506.1 OmpA family protein [Methylophaga thiooxydans DMS010]
MARRKKHEEHENHERWLVSYADFITLLFAFFVVMYSISSVNEGKYRVLSDTLEAVFSDPVRSKNPIQIGEISRGEGKLTAEPGEPEKADYKIDLPEIPHRPPPATENDIRTIKELTKQLSGALADMIETEDVIIKQGEDWLELEIKSRVLFESGEARLERAAVPVIGKIADILQTSANPIQVEGFTDNNPINTSRFPSNWELSAARAASVVHLLDRYGIQPDRMSAIGYGEYKPIADNATEEGRQKNRRVVLVVLGSDKSRRDLDIFDTNAGQVISSENNIDNSSSLPPISMIEFPEPNTQAEAQP